MYHFHDCSQRPSVVAQCDDFGVIVLASSVQGHHRRYSSVESWVGAYFTRNVRDPFATEGTNVISDVLYSQNVNQRGYQLAGFIAWNDFWMRSVRVVLVWFEDQALATNSDARNAQTLTSSTFWLVFIALPRRN